MHSCNILANPSYGRFFRKSMLDSMSLDVMKAQTISSSTDSASGRDDSQQTDVEKMMRRMRELEEELRARALP